MLIPYLVLLAVLPTATPKARARPAPVISQPTYHGRANQLRVKPPRLDDTGVTIDGELSEPQWSQAAILTGFSQFAPNDGVAADDSTEVLVWYSSTAIHFGIRAFERHGAPVATLADRDKIASDDNVQILLSTFNDGRQAIVFGVNPLGVQADGTIVESNQSRSGGFGNTALARDPMDPSADYQFSSKGHVTSDGYVVEVRIPFKSLKYQSAEEQSWGLNIVRDVQHSGHEYTWTPARRATLSFLSQSGTLENLSGLRRGLVIDVNPEVTQRSPGLAPGAPGSRFSARTPEVGGNARWGVTNNLTLNGTVNPDFSQIESDAGQLVFDPRQALFFAEKRPFFLDGIEQFSTPGHPLIYTRSIIQPVGAVKLAGKVSGTNIAFLSAVDDAIGSASRQDHPVFNLLRVQKDLGASSKLGIAYTDRVEGANYNRVADVDANYLFGDIYSLQGQYAESYTKTGSTVRNAPLWRLAANRAGKEFGFNYSLDAIHEDFRASSGYINRGGVATAGFDHRWTMFGAPGSLFEAVTFNPGYFSTWRYQSFVHQGEALEKKLHFNLTSTMRGGWTFGTGYFVETFGYDPGLYASYRILGTHNDTLPFAGVPRIGNSEPYLSVNSPAGNRVSFNAFYLYGRDENFYEWASSNIVISTYGVTVRPTDKLRVNATYNLQSYNRRSDGSIVGNNRIPRLKLEYQIARPVFVRVVGEYDSFFRDALRDEGGTRRPILAYDSCNGGVYGVTRRCQNASFRGDFLFSYQPNPGTVVFFGYGAGFKDARVTPLPVDFPAAFRFDGYTRTDDAFFIKASYLFRL